MGANAHAVGFMQGRLSPRVDGKIQAFPAATWEQEFPAARALALDTIEWTLDQAGLRANPLLTVPGRARIAALAADHRLRVASVTGDCFMQAPFWKAAGDARAALLDDLDAVLDACADLGVRHVVVPLVDNGGLADADQEAVLLDALLARADRLRRDGLVIAFESDFGPDALARLIDRFPAGPFGVNYDIGNSASLGFDPRAEIAAYGARIVHVHVKDRLRGGTTVPLGTGAADFEVVFDALARAHYAGDFVLQTARAEDDDHAGVLGRYAAQTRHWIAAAFGTAR